jgi:hypothetical protein
VRWAPARGDAQRPPAYAALGEVRLASPSAVDAVRAALPALALLAAMATSALLAAGIAFDRCEVR